MPQRLKSRLGCQACKQRKIKPCCGNCSKTRKSCIYVDPTHADKLHHDGPHLNVEDLELMHNYCTSTCMTLSFHTPRELYLIEAPKLAFADTFLLHAILAVSAVHLALERPENTYHYRLLGERHRDTSLKLVTPVLLRHAVTRGDTMLAYSSLCSVFSIAWAGLVMQALDPDEDPGRAAIACSLEFIQNTRGIAAIVVASRGQIAAGPFAAVLQGHEPPTSGELPPDEQELMDNIQMLWNNDRNIAAIDLEAYRDAAEKMRQTMIKCHVTPTAKRTGHVNVWVTRVSERYMELLVVGDRIAVVILAHFWFVMHRYHQEWWVGDGPRLIIRAIHDALPQPWQKWVLGPMRAVGAM